MKSRFFAFWNRLLADRFYHHYGDRVKTWNGFILQAVDGSTAYLINKQEVADHFGVQRHQFGATPMARIVQVHDVLNDLTVWGTIASVRESETEIIRSNIHQLRKNSLTLFDRGFPSFSLMYMMMSQEEPLHFVMRCRKNQNAEVSQFLREDKQSSIVELSATSQAISTLYKHGFIVTKATRIRVRLVKIRLSTGEDEILITILLDEQKYTVADLYELYGLRWRIETAFGKQKNQLQMEQFSGHKVNSIEQDYYACLMVSNLQSLIEKQCESYLQQVNSRRKHDYKVNRNNCWAHLKHRIVQLFMQQSPQQVLELLEMEFQQTLEPIRPGRSFKRNKATSRTTGKYQTRTNYKRAV